MKSEEKRSIYMKARNTFVQIELCWAVPVSLCVPPLPCPSTPWSAPWWLRTETNSRNNKNYVQLPETFLKLSFIHHLFILQNWLHLSYSQFSLKIFKVKLLYLRDCQSVFNTEREEEGQHLCGHHLLRHAELGIWQRHLVNTWKTKIQMFFINICWKN